MCSIVVMNRLDDIWKLNNQQGKVTFLSLNINRLLHVVRAGLKSEAMRNARHNGDNNTPPSAWHLTRRLILRYWCVFSWLVKDQLAASHNGNESAPTSPTAPPGIIAPESTTAAALQLIWSLSQLLNLVFFLRLCLGRGQSQKHCALITHHVSKTHYRDASLEVIALWSVAARQ